jgi:hypothetical protein
MGLVLLCLQQPCRMRVLAGLTGMRSLHIGCMHRLCGRDPACVAGLYDMYAQQGVLDAQQGVLGEQMCRVLIADSNDVDVHSELLSGVKGWDI